MAERIGAARGAAFLYGASEAQGRGASEASEPPAVAGGGMPGESDRTAVARQIGREPRGRWRVARRCACGLPQVIETHPLLDDGTPFPTLYWLTCRPLSQALGGLESGGWMEVVNRRLRSDPRFRSDLAAATAAYVARRDALAPLGKQGHPGGGPDRVKCLHAHAAHDLVTGDNPVGRAALEEIGWTEPTEPCA